MIALILLRNIDENIAAVLQQVLFFLLEIALSGTVYLSNGIVCTIVDIRSEINESIAQFGFAVAWAGLTHIRRFSSLYCACPFFRVEIPVVKRTGIVIHTIASTENLLCTALNILNIGTGIKHFFIIHLADGIVAVLTGCAHTALKVSCVFDLSTQVVTAIDVVADVWETIGTDNGLGMPLDVSIT